MSPGRGLLSQSGSHTSHAGAFFVTGRIHRIPFTERARGASDIEATLARMNHLELAGLAVTASATTAEPAPGAAAPRGKAAAVLGVGLQGGG